MISCWHGCWQNWLQANKLGKVDSGDILQQYLAAMSNSGAGLPIYHASDNKTTAHDADGFRAAPPIVTAAAASYTTPNGKWTVWMQRRSLINTTNLWKHSTSSDCTGRQPGYRALASPATSVIRDKMKPFMVLNYNSHWGPSYSNGNPEIWSRRVRDLNDQNELYVHYMG